MPTPSPRARFLRPVRRGVPAVLGLAAGAGALVLMLRGTRLEEALALLRGTGLSITWLALPYALSTVATALPWVLLMPRDHRPGWGAAIGSRFAAASVNVILPSGLVGEPVRLRCVAMHGRASAADALVWDRALYMVASAVFILLVAAACPPGAGDAVRAASLLAVLAYAWAAAGMVGASRVPWLRRGIVRLFGRGGSSAKAPPRPRLRRMLDSVALHVASRVLQGAELWVGALVLGLPLGVDSAAMLAAAVVLTGVAFPVVPGQLGVQEAALAAATTALGWGDGSGLALALLVRLRQVVFVPLGLIVGGSPLMACPEPTDEASPS